MSSPREPWVPTKPAPLAGAMVSCTDREALPAGSEPTGSDPRDHRSVPVRCHEHLVKPGGRGLRIHPVLRYRVAANRSSVSPGFWRVIDRAALVNFGAKLVLG
jgi:hypothetical protein